MHASIQNAVVLQPAIIDITQVKIEIFVNLTILPTSVAVYCRQDLTLTFLPPNLPKLLLLHASGGVFKMLLMSA